MSRPARVQVDLAAASHNLAQVRRLAPNSRIVAVVKADAYGHGARRISGALNDTDCYGVACLEEAVRLREHGVSKPILLMEGPFDESELPVIAELDLETVVHHQAQQDMILSRGGQAPLKVWLKIDTGMHRLGITPEQVVPMWQRLRDSAAVQGAPILMTHLAGAHLDDHDKVAAQVACFEHATAGLDSDHSVANSAAVAGFPATHRDWVRPGIMLYGIPPVAGRDASGLDLKPVMTLDSALIATKTVAAGETVGYGAAFTCPETMPVGIVAMGYGDGYPRRAGSGAPVAVNGVRTQVIGFPSMDMLAVDLRPVPQAQVGDRVEMWGHKVSVTEVAEHAGTNAYELLCAVKLRARFEVEP